MGEGRDGGISARAVTGAVPALLRLWSAQTPVCAAKSGDFALRTPARATVLWSDFSNRSTDTGGEFTAWLPASHRWSSRAGVFPARIETRQVSEQLRGYLSPGRSFSGLDYTNQGGYVKFETKFLIFSIDACSSFHSVSPTGCFLYSVIISRIFVRDGSPYRSTTFCVQGKNHK